MKQIAWKVEELNDVQPLALMELLSEGWERGGETERIELRSDLITFEGNAESADAVQKIADSLEKLLGRDPVIETGQASEGKIGFTIQIRRVNERSQ